MLFSVIIPTYQDHVRLGKCVNSVLACKGDFDFEIIVVDNSKEHYERLFEFDNPKVTVVHEPIPGSYAARNCGAAISKGDILAFTDSDCIVDINWLLNAYNFFQNEQCDMIGGEVVIFKTQGGSEWVYIFEKHNAFPQSVNIPKGHGVTANLFVKRGVYEDLGGFDSEIKSGGDWEFTERAVNKNYRLKYAENVIINHPSRYSMKSFFKKEKRLVAGGYCNTKKRHNHSGLRMLFSHLWRNSRKVFTRVRNNMTYYDKGVVLLISIGVFFFRAFIILFIFMGFLDPKKIRQ